MRVRDAKFLCPFCKEHLKTDNTNLWCESADCDFDGLIGTLVFEGKLVKGEVAKLKKEKRTKKQQIKDAMGIGFVEPQARVAQSAEQRFRKAQVADSVSASGSQTKLL